MTNNWLKSTKTFFINLDRKQGRCEKSRRGELADQVRLRWDRGKGQSFQLSVHLY